LYFSINSCVLVSFLLPFAWHFPPLVLACLSVHMFSNFFLNYYIWPICPNVSLSVCTPCSTTLLHLHVHRPVWVCVCACVPFVCRFDA
jgi:hypothetical protein